MCNASWLDSFRRTESSAPPDANSMLPRCSTAATTCTHQPEVSTPAARLQQQVSEQGVALLDQSPIVSC